MARIRYLKPEFFTDEDLADLQPITRIAFEGLWCYADKSGRMEDRPKYLKAMIFPYDNVDMEKQLSILAGPKHNGKPFIQRYSVNGLSIIQIRNWHKHQKPHHTEAESKLPPAPPLMEKGMEKGMEKQLNPSAELNNGTETVKQRLKKNSECVFNLPDWFPQDLWQRFISHRKAAKAPLTKESFPSFLIKFTNLNEQGLTPQYVIDKMIEKGWRWYKPEWDKEQENGNKKTRSAVDEGLARFLASEDEPGRD